VSAADRDDLRRLFAYNRWANLRLLDAAEELTPEELGRRVESSFPSVLETLEHLLGAEWVWLTRWKGTNPTDFPEDAPAWKTVAAVRERWDRLWEEQREFLDRLSLERVESYITYRVFSGAEDEQVLGDLMRHVVNHATYHRGQLVTMLRQLGKEPPSTDFIRYLREVGR
jgi:uncharacterized damage-inducible protein DinB